MNEQEQRSHKQTVAFSRPEEYTIPSKVNVSNRVSLTTPLLAFILIVSVFFFILFIIYALSHLHDMPGFSSDTIHGVFNFIGSLSGLLIAGVVIYLGRHALKGMKEIAEILNVGVEAWHKYQIARGEIHRNRVVAMQEHYIGFVNKAGEIVVEHVIEEKQVHNHRYMEGVNVPQIGQAQELPGPIDMIDVLRRWELSTENIFLALAKGNQPLSAPLGRNMHIVHDGPTDSGKTSQFYAEEIMLCKLGVDVIHCNPHFAPLTKKGEDWRPIARALEMKGPLEIIPGLQIPRLIRSCNGDEETFEMIANILKILSTKEIGRRYKMQEQGDFSYQPLYVFVDELRAVIERYPEAATFLVDIICRGRAAEVFVSAASQGFLSADVSLPGSSRENFQTVYFLGGSVHSGAKLLDVSVKDMNAMLREERKPLGRGIALFRNEAASPLAQFVRLPFANNDFAYYMLGRADDWVLPEYRKRHSQTIRFSETPLNSRETVIEADATVLDDTGNVYPDTENLLNTSSVSTETRETIRRMNSKGVSHRDIAYAVGLSGRKYDMYQAVCTEMNISLK